MILLGNLHSYREQPFPTQMNRNIFLVTECIHELTFDSVEESPVSQNMILNPTRQEHISNSSHIALTSLPLILLGNFHSYKEWSFPTQMNTNISLLTECIHELTFDYAEESPLSQWNLHSYRERSFQSRRRTYHYSYRMHSRAHHGFC